jgi:hypothetical protein
VFEFGSTLSILLSSTSMWKWNVLVPRWFILLMLNERTTCVHKGTKLTARHSNHNRGHLYCFHQCLSRMVQPLFMVNQSYDVQAIIISVEQIIVFLGFLPFIKWFFTFNIDVSSVELQNLSYRIWNSSAWWLDATCSHCNCCWSLWLARFWQYPTDGCQHNYWRLGPITRWWNKQCIPSSHCSYWEQPRTQFSVIQHMLHRHWPLGNILCVRSAEVRGENRPESRLLGLH